MSTGALQPGVAAAADSSATPQGGAAAAAPATFWTRLDAGLDRVSDHLNPILVKETRQALRSRQFVLWFLLLLAACWLVTIGGVAWMGPGVQYAAGGGLMFMCYYCVLAFAVVIVVPYAAFRSLSSEQEENTRDVLMVSALRPSQIINGKLGGAVLQIGVYLSALSPCLAFTYLLRGIDLRTILLLPVFAVAVAVCLSMVALLLASTSRQRYAQVMLSVALVVGLVIAFFATVGAASGVVQEGYRLFQEDEFWFVVGILANLLLCVFLLAYFAATGLNTFASANRSTPLRRVMFFTQACLVGWFTGIWIANEYDPDVLVAAGSVGGCFWFVMGALLTSERPVFSERVRRGLPTTQLGRVFGTWFNPGPGVGYVFTLSSLSVLLGLLAVALVVGDPTTQLLASWELSFFVLGVAYIAAYLGLGRMVISGLRRLAPLSLLGGFLVQFLLLLGGVGLPELLRATMRSRRPPFGWYDVTNPFRTLSAFLYENLTPNEALLVVILVTGVALCILLLNVRLAAREVQLTRAPLPQRVIEDDLELRPPEQAVSNPWGDLRQPG